METISGNKREKYFFFRLPTIWTVSICYIIILSSTKRGYSFKKKTVVSPKLLFRILLYDGGKKTNMKSNLLRHFRNTGVVINWYKIWKLKKRTGEKNTYLGGFFFFFPHYILLKHRSTVCDFTIIAHRCTTKIIIII